MRKTYKSLVIYVISFDCFLVLLFGFLLLYSAVVKKIKYFFPIIFFHLWFAGTLTYFLLLGDGLGIFFFSIFITQIIVSLLKIIPLYFIIFKS